MQRDPEWRAFGECRGEGRRGVRRCSAWSEFNGGLSFLDDEEEEEEEEVDDSSESSTWSAPADGTTFVGAPLLLLP